jgi:hypothetical protein
MGGGMDWNLGAIIFVSLLLVTPAIQLAVGWARKWRARRALQHERGARVIPIVLDLQTVATFGLPVARFEQLPLPNEVARAVHATPRDRPIDLVVDLPAGVAFDAEPVADALAARTAPVTLIVPRHALTGGIALARAADAVLLGPGAVLSNGQAAADSRPGADPGPASPAETCDLAGLQDLGLPAAEGVPSALPAYLARFREPLPTRRKWPLYMARPRSV